MKTKKSPRKVFIRTFGCQMNNADSELVYSMLLSQGYVKAKSYEDADVILFNTCSVRKHAEDRVWGKVGQLKKGMDPRLRGDDSVRRGNDKRPIIGIIGCMAKAQGDEIFKRLPHVNFICGPSDIYAIVDLIEQVQARPKKHFAEIGRRQRLLKMDPRLRGDDIGYREERIKAGINISYGCNNFCSYCIVPYVRGREISRKQKDIIDEAKALVDDGVKEIMLLGQNVNSYQYSVNSNQKNNFIKLLEKINKIDGLLRIRFMTSHPKDANIDLFKAIRDLDKVCEHLHLALQSGSDRILKLMNRKYTSADYLKLINQYRKIVKRGSLTTDAIVGFPTETDKDFYQTYTFMQKIEFDGAFIFKYSTRPHTAAAKMEDDVAMHIKQERNQALLKLQEDVFNNKIKSLMNTTQQTLAVGEARRAPVSKWLDNGGYYIKGRTAANLQVIYPGNDDMIGHISDVKIKDIEGKTLIGERI